MTVTTGRSGVLGAARERHAGTGHDGTVSSLTLTGNVVYFGSQLLACLVVGSLGVALHVPFLVRAVLIVVAVVVVSRAMVSTGVLRRFRAGPGR